MEFKIREYGRGSNIGEEELQEIARVIETAETFAYGPLRDKFEAEFAAYCGVKHAVSTTSATTALAMACQILRLTEGDEIIGTPQTFRATYIAAAGRKVAVRFADIDPVTLNIDPSTVEAKITPRTKAIFVMHYGGNPVDMEPIMEIAGRRGLAVVEDAAHAPGASYKGKKIGSIADITCFSFHSLKNMSTLGEGGMLTTNDGRYAEYAKRLRTMDLIGEQIPRADTHIGPYEMPKPSINDHAGRSYSHDYANIDEWGGNVRMSEFQAAVGSVQLLKLDDMNLQRTKAAERLTKGLSGIEGIVAPRTTPGGLNVWHLYPCFLDTAVVKAGRDEFIHYLQEEKGIQIILRYFPVHLSDYMRYLGHKFGECPVCERVWFERQLNLPMNPRMPDDEIDYIVESMREAVKRFS